MEQLEPDRLELLMRYKAELLEIEHLPPVAVSITAEQALALVNLVQIATANPVVRNNPLLQDAIAAAKQVQSSFNPNTAIYEVLELGWNDQEKGGNNLPSQLLVSRCREKVRRSPSHRPHRRSRFI